MSCLNFNCDITINNNPLNLNIDDYLDIAIRDNNKRRFLFISKKLGKHLPVKPYKVDELGCMLAKAYRVKYKEYYKEKQIVIGFAETATCLAHSFFNYLENADFFIHTTREEIKESRKLEFKEEHSHATEQNLYIDNLEEIEKLDSIILVDDEITTAKTCINMIKQLQSVYNAKKYVIASILNWVDDNREEEIKSQGKELNCKIEFIYLFNGSFKFKFDENILLEDKIEESISNNEKIEVNNIKLNFSKYIGDKKYLYYTGRFGINREEQNELKDLIHKEASKLKVKYTGHKILALGIEEFMYVPMMLSKEIEGDVYYHSITRSPIISENTINYPIKSKYMLESFYNKNANYIYNLQENEYKECFIFVEINEGEDKVNGIKEILKMVGIKKINIVRF